MKISQNLFTYSLNKDDMTASIIKCDSSNKDIIIPRSITYSNQDYVIKKICYPCFTHNKHIKNISFANDSEIQTIGNKSFNGSSIEQITIPKSIENLEYDCFSDCTNLKIIEIPEDSQLIYFGLNAFNHTLIKNIFIPKKINKLDTLISTSNIINFSISKENENFKYDDNYKIIIGKDGSNEFTNLIYVHRDAKEIIIPSFVKKINSYAICYCKNLKRIEYEPNSQLSTIEEDFLFESSITNIIFPSQTNDFCSKNFDDLDSIEFLSNEFKGYLYFYDSTSIVSFPNCKNVNIKINECSDFIIFICPNANIYDDFYYDIDECLFGF